jgi:hypothetical protein
MTPALNHLVNATIKDHIRECGARFGTVVYFKKDGTIRRLTYQMAAMPARVLGTERGKKAAATRAENNPYLLTVWDVHKRAFRTVNLETVLTVKSGGKLTRYRNKFPVAGIPGAFALAPVLKITAGEVLTQN